jgi:hypothetical protein
MEDEGAKQTTAGTNTLKEHDIVSRLLPARRSLLAAIGGSLAATFSVGIAGCATPTRRSDSDPSDPTGRGSVSRTSDKDPSDPARGSTQRQPGLYSGPGFGYNYSGEISGKVGLPLDARSQARCEGSGWSADRLEVLTGALPPGLSFRQSDLAITGVPTRGGTWYLRVQWTNVRCAGNSYGNKTQDLSIKTEGSSAPQTVR